MIIALAEVARSSRTAVQYLRAHGSAITGPYKSRNLRLTDGLEPGTLKGGSSAQNAGFGTARGGDFPLIGLDGTNGRTTQASSCIRRTCRCGCNVHPRPRHLFETRHLPIRHCRNGWKKCEWLRHTPLAGTSPRPRGPTRPARAYHYSPTCGPSAKGNRNRVRQHHWRDTLGNSGEAAAPGHPSRPRSRIYNSHSPGKARGHEQRDSPGG